MAFRRVLVLIQVSSLRSDRQAHDYKPNKTELRYFYLNSNYYTSFKMQ